MDYIPIVRGAEMTVETTSEWYRRESVDPPGSRPDDDHQWEVCSVSEVPPDVIDREIKRAARKIRIAEFGYDPEDPRTPFAVITRGPGTSE